MGRKDEDDDEEEDRGVRRYATDNARDTIAGSDGDARFVGVYPRLWPQIPNGFAHEATNLRFADGRAITRRGLTTPVHFCWTAESGTHTVLGSGIFSDPDGLEWLLLATPAAVIQLRSGHTPRAIAIPAALTGRCSFVQTFATVLLFRGSDALPLQWDGEIGSAFEAVSQADLGDDTDPIPNGPDRVNLRPVRLGDRLIVPFDRTQLAISDILSFTRYDAALSTLNATTGNDDVLTALYPFTQSALLVFRDQSIDVVTGVSGDLGSLARQTVNLELGCIAAGTPQMIGADVLFLAANGVYRVQQVIQERIESAPVPVSYAIQPTIDRINWNAAVGAVAAVQGDYYFLAVPLDGEERNNVILPCNTTIADPITGQRGVWEGVHELPGDVRIDALHVTDYHGRKALYAVDYATGLVHLLYYNFGSDRVSQTVHEIPTRLATRPYFHGSQGVKRTHRAKVALQTHRPSVTVSVVRDGVSEINELRSITKDRTLYYAHDTPEYDPTNENDDHAAPGREDYSVVTPFQTQSGLCADRMQACVEPVQIRLHGRHASLVIENETGVCAVEAIEIDGEEAERRARTSI